MSELQVCTTHNRRQPFPPVSELNLPLSCTQRYGSVGAGVHRGDLLYMLFIQPPVRPYITRPVIHSGEYSEPAEAFLHRGGCGGSRGDEATWGASRGGRKGKADLRGDRTIWKAAPSAGES